MRRHFSNLFRVVFTWFLGNNKKPQNTQLAIWQQLTFGLEEIKTPSVIGGNNDPVTPPIIDINSSQPPTFPNSNSFTTDTINPLDACPVDGFNVPVESPSIFDPNTQFYNPNPSGGVPNNSNGFYNDISNIINSEKPPVILPIDPPGVNKDDAIFIKSPINDFTISSNSPAYQIDLNQIFNSKNQDILSYQIVASDNNAVSVFLSGNTLTISAQKPGLSNITIRAKDQDGNSLNHTFSVIISELNSQSQTVENLNLAFNELDSIFKQNQDLVTALDTEKADTALDKIMDILDENPDLLKLITQPESLALLGINNTSIETIKKFLQSPEVAAEFGLDVTLGQVLNNPDSDKLDKFLMNGENAVDILPSNAKQPKVGFIDFTQNQHIQKVTTAATNINPFLNQAQKLTVTNGNWAKQLVEFVNSVIKSGENNGIANLSFELSQLDEIGDMTRYELTPIEQTAIEYAKKNNILLVVAAGNTGDKMSALGAASQQFDNIITVGSVNQLQQKTDYSSYGDELTLVAPGGEWNNNPQAFVGTSKSTAYVTAAASLAWAANPDLSYQQIKQILIDTSQDLDTSGWDVKTGAGLIDVKEAINRAQLIEPQIVNPTPNPEIKFFSGEGRVWTLVRPASPETENAISALENSQENLFQQLQNLVYLGNPNLTITELKSQLENQLNLKLDNYQEIIVEAAISTAKYEQLKTALDLAFQNHQIEQNQLQQLQQREQELKSQLTAFQDQKSDLEAATQKQLIDIQQKITELEAKLAQSAAKLSNPFADADDNLQTDSQSLKTAANEKQKLAEKLGKDANSLAQEQQKYINLANNINPQRWQVVGYESRISGRNREIWGWGQDPQLVKQKNQYIWQADIVGKNSQYLQELAQKAEEQAITLNKYAQFLEDRKNNLDIGEASVEDAGKILEFLQKQQEQQAEISKKYWQEVSIAEARRNQSQNIANYHNSQINQWQIVGTKSGRSGRGKTDIWGTVHYPEHIAPRDQAQLQANLAEQQRKDYEVLARQAQQQADSLQTQVDKLQTRIKDWPVLKQGIDYEIIANQQHLQAEKDLLVENTVIQEQKLETVNLQSSQLETELNDLTNETLPQQQQVTTEIENRLQYIQSQLQVVQQEQTIANNNVQTFLELEGFNLPTRERLAILDKQFQQLENEKLEINQNLVNLNQQILQNPNNQVLQPLVDIWVNRLTQLEQDLDWVKIQKQELVMTVGDSPERLAISQLINELEKPETPASLKSKVTNLQKMESGGGSFLAGFDNLESRFNEAKTEQNQTQQSLGNLQNEYLNLGLNKADIENNQIPHKQNEIAGKEKEIVQTQNSISQSETKLDNLQKQLPLLENNVVQKSAEINQEQQNLADLNNTLNTQQQEKINLLTALDNLNQQKSELAQQLIDKYREIELTEQYLQQVKNEVIRLQSRLEVFNQADALEQNYQNNWQDSQTAIEQQNQVTQALLNTRQTGEPFRQQLASLEQQLNNAKSNLEKVQTLEEKLADIQQAVVLTNIQKENQRLLKQSLDDSDVVLGSQQTYLNNLAQNHRQKMWYWNGREYAYNSAEAQAYLQYLQQASFIADQRNQRWEQSKQAETKIKELDEQLTQQKSEITKTETDLAALESATQIQDKIITLQSNIDAVNEQLKPFITQENQQIQELQQAVNTANQGISDLQQTIELQSNSLRQLISLGVLASESDVDFFDTQIQPKVNLFTEQLQQRNEELSQQQSSLNQLIDSWEQQSNTVEDTTSKQYLTNLINQSQSQLNNLGNLKFENQAVITKLEAQLNQAVAALETLRQKQELEIRQKIEINDTRLESLQSQLNSEQAVEYIKNNDTVLAYAQLADQIENDARNGVKNWTQQYQDGYLMAKNADESMQNLSQSVDELIAHITDNLPAPLGKYNSSQTALGNSIATLGVIIPRVDGYEQNVIDTEQEIEKIKQRILQDAQLWEEIAPIAIRYGLESEQLQEFLSQNYPQKIADSKQKANEFEQQRQQYQANADWWNSQINSNGLGFDANYYLSKNPDVAAAVARGGIASAWEHFIRWGQYEGRNPSASFDNAYYLAHNPDVATAVARGGFRSGVQHFVQHGQYENRAHNPVAEANKNAAQTAANNAVQQRDSLLQQAVDLEDYRKNFLIQHPENGTIIDLLQQEILEGSSSNSQISQQLNATRADDLLNANSLEGLNPLQQLFNKAKATQAELEAKGNATLTQANWYQNQAAYHWSVSRKNGPYWWEERCSSGRSGRRNCQWIQHVDQNWVLWNQYSQIFPQLRQQGQDYLVEADKWRKEKERLEPLVNQWSDANNAANEAEPTIREARDIFAQLEAEREKIPQFKTQLETLEGLLPTLREQLAEAQQEAQKTRATVTQDWTEYDVNSEEEQQVLADILQHRGEVNRQAIETQAKLADSERWVENQSVALSTELSQSQALYSQLNTQHNNLNQQILNLQNQGGNDLQITELKSKLSQIEQSLPLLENKVTILTSQQTALTHKRTLLTAQNEVIRVEQKLLDAYIQDPFADNSNLEQELLDARAALAEAQRLAEQAEKASQALTAPLQELKIDLLAQNDEHLQAAKVQQQILKDLIDKSQLTANLTLELAKSNIQLNDLKTQAIIRLQQATDAGSKEAKALLDVAKYNDMATVAEIYYRDYSDLASDKGGGCTHGFARPEDRILADQYYQQMLNNRELQRQTQQQANYFGNIRKTAESQLQTLQEEQNKVAKLVEELNNKLATNQEEKAATEQELAISQIRLGEISRIREVTEQTFSNLVMLENLNLAQAQLEMEMAEKLQNDIEQTVKDRMERDRLELERQRLETTAKIAQLQQLMNEDSLRQSLNEIRANLGIETLDATEDRANLQTQLAQLLTNLQNLQTEQSDSLDDNLKALLAETMGDIHLALQGKEASTIQDSLLQAMSGLIEQIQPYKEQINQIDLEDQLDYQLLQTAQQDLQSASQKLLKDLERGKALGVEEEIINPLYIEALTKVAYAEQAVDISNELAAQGKEMLEQIIKQRIAERKARKKAFWNKILSIISTVLSLVGAVLTFVPGANLIGLSLAAIGGAISAVQAAINGDWMGAIFSAVMAGASFVGGAIGNALKVGKTMIMGMSKIVAEKVLTTIKAFQSLASGAFNSVRNILSGDKIMGFLQIIGGLAGAATSGLQNAILNSPLGEFGYKVVESLSKTPTLIYGGIKSIQSGDWVSGIGNIVKGIISLAKTWTNDFNSDNESPGEKIANILENISSVGIGVSKFITGGLNGLLEGVGDIVDGFGDDIQKWVENLIASGNCECPPSEEELAEAAELIVDEISDLSPAEIVDRLEGLNPELQAEVIDYFPVEEQISIIGKLSPAQQTEVVPNLSQETKEELVYRYLEKYQELKQQFENAQFPGTNTSSVTVYGVTYSNTYLSRPLTQIEAFVLIVQNSLPHFPDEIGQRLTDPAFLAAMTTAAKDGAFFGGLIALAQFTPASPFVDTFLALTAPLALGYVAGTISGNHIITYIEAGKAIQHAWWLADQIAKDSSQGNILAHDIESNIQSAGEILAFEGANALEPTIRAYGTNLAGLIGGLVGTSGVKASITGVKSFITELLIGSEDNYLVQNGKLVQKAGNYKPDIWKTGVLSPGTKVYQLAPWSSEFYTTDAILALPKNAPTIYEYLQIKPRNTLRPFLVEYEVKNSTSIAESLIKNNPQYGKGGLPQMIIPKPALQETGKIIYLNNNNIFKD